MAIALQVLYPVGSDTSFDFDYYVRTHLKLVQEHMGAHIDRTVVTRGLAGGPDTPPGYHATASIIFADQSAMDAAMAVSGPVIADVPNFTNVKPDILIGEVIG